MKKTSIQKFFIILVIAVSAASYTYLSTINPDQLQNHSSTVFHTNQLDDESIENNTNSEKLVLPELNLIFKLIEAGSRFLPVSTGF